MNRLLIPLVALLTAVPSIAQDRERAVDAATLAAARDLGRRIIGWVRSDILPQAQTWKSRLDAAMSADDLNQLNALRARATALRQRATAAGASVRTGWQKEDYAAVKAARAELRKITEERRGLAEQLRPLAQKYRQTLEAIGADAKPKIKQWSEQGRELGKRWWADNRDDLSPRAAQAIGRLVNRRGDMLQMLGIETRKKIAVARFMLWDGSDFTVEIERALEAGEIQSLTPRLR